MLNSKITRLVAPKKSLSQRLQKHPPTNERKHVGFSLDLDKLNTTLQEPLQDMPWLHDVPLDLYFGDEAPSHGVFMRVFGEANVSSVSEI